MHVQIKVTEGGLAGRWVKVTTHHRGERTVRAIVCPNDADLKAEIRKILPAATTAAEQTTMDFVTPGETGE